MRTIIFVYFSNINFFTIINKLLYNFYFNIVYLKFQKILSKNKIKIFNMDKDQTPSPDLKNEIPQENLQASPFNENENIILNDTPESTANVINKPVPIKNSTEIDSNTNNNNSDSGSELNPSIISVVFSYLKSPFLKIGKSVQNLLSKLSEKIQIQSSYKFFLIFLGLGLLFFFFAFLCLPFIIFNPGKFLRLLTLGNIFIMLSFLYYYGSKDFFSFLIDEKRTGVVFAHLLSMCFSFFISIFVGGYFIQLLLDFILGITTIMFILTLLPGGSGGISTIKNMIFGPGLFLLNNLKGKIFGDNSNNGSVLPQ